MYAYILQKMLILKYCQHLNPKKKEVKKMLTSPPRPGQQRPNILVNLKQKKKQLLEQEGKLKEKVKQYFSDITIILQDKQTETLHKIQTDLFNTYENIDIYCSMKQNQRILAHHMEGIQKILAIRIDVFGDAGFKDMLANWGLEIGSVGADGFGEARTSKKGTQKQYQAIKQAYQNELLSLEQRIQKLSLRQHKLKQRLHQLQSRQKMKKVGNSYLPYQEKHTSTIQVERLETQNKLLKAQITSSSQKILSLLSQNSILKQSTHMLLPTQKKRQLCESIQQQSSLQQTQQIKRIAALQQQLQLVRSYLHTAEQQYHQYQLMCDEEIRKYQEKLAQLQCRYQKERDDKEKSRDRVRILDIEVNDKCCQILELKGLCDGKVKELDSLKEMNCNYARLVSMKQTRIQQLQSQLVEKQKNWKQHQKQLKTDIQQKSNTISTHLQTLSQKHLQLQSQKSALKKHQQQKQKLIFTLTTIKQQHNNIITQYEAIQQQIQKCKKQKESAIKKQINKLRKQLKKQYEDEKNIICEEFKVKCGEFVGRMEVLRGEIGDIRDRYERRYRVQENWMAVFKSKVMFQVKDMIEKVNKGSKDKLIPVIQSYIQSQASICLKNSQIKALKQQLSQKKAPVCKKQPKPSTQAQLSAELHQFSVQVYTQKLQIQQQLYESRLQEQQQQNNLLLEEKQNKIEQLTIKVQNQDKSIKQFKSQLSNATKNGDNADVIELKKSLGVREEKLEKLEGLVGGLRGNLGKVQGELQQVRDQLKLKKDIIQGLKKQVKDRQSQKCKLNQTINSLLQQVQKHQKTKKESTKKQQLYQQFKQKLINQTQLSQQLFTLRTSLAQQQKLHRQQLNKKQQTIKQYKINQQILNKKIKQLSTMEDQLQELKHKCKKFKMECDRKDGYIQHVKEKIGKMEHEFGGSLGALEAELKKVRREVEVEKGKVEGLKAKLGRVQANERLLKVCIVRLYENMGSRRGQIMQSMLKQFNSASTKPEYKSRYEFATQLEVGLTGQRQREQKQKQKQKYKQALSILQISCEQLEESPQIQNNKISQFYNTNIDTCHSPMIYKTQPNNLTAKVDQDELVKLSRLLESDEVDCKAVLAVFGFTNL